MDFNPLSALSTFLSPTTTAETRPPLSTPPYQADSSVQAPATEGGLTYAKGTKGAGGEFGTLAYDPAQSASILSNLEKFRDERVKLANPNDDALYDAVAWGQTYPGGQGLQNLQARRSKKSEMLKDAFDAQMQIDQFKASQRNQERDYAQKQEILSKMGVPGFGAGATGAGATGAGATGAGGYQMSPQMAMSLMYAKPGDDFNKQFAEYAKNFEENEHKFATNPVTYDQKEYYDRNTGKIEKYSALDIRMGKPEIDASRVKLRPETDDHIFPYNSNPIIDKLQEAVIGQESSGGKADTSKPNVQGAIGPGQFLPGTWKQYQDQNIIPKNFDINNPNDNKQATRFLLAHYYDKYNGDINKVLAAYHGGEGSIRKDGTINTDAKDALGVSNQQYIDQVKAKIPGSFTNEPATKVAGKGMSYSDFLIKNKAEEERATSEAKVVGEDYGNRRKAFEAAHEESNDNISNVRYIQELAKNHPNAFGILQDPTLLSAIGNMLKSGVQDGTIGSHHISAIEEALRQLKPGMEKEDIIAAEEAISRLAKLELSAAKVWLKGQGAVSDAERALIAKLTGSISNSPTALINIMKANEIGFEYNKEIGDVYQNWKKDNKGASFEDFKTSDIYKTISNKHVAKLKELEANAGKYAGSTNPATAKQPPAPPPGYNPKWRSIVKGLAGGDQ